MELEGEGRPRRLAVVIRRVDIIPIRSLQARPLGWSGAALQSPPALCLGSLQAWWAGGAIVLRRLRLPSSTPPLPIACSPALHTLQAFLKGQDEELAYHAIQVGAL